MTHKLIPALVSLVLMVFPSYSEMPSTANRPLIPDAVLHVAEAATDTATAAETEVMRKVWVTAYSSTPEETDDTPFITALGTSVREGIIATNMYPFGTRIRIPEFFGERTFIVEDRMHPRKKNFVDIWMPTKQDAKNFGIAFTDIVVLD